MNFVHFSSDPKHVAKERKKAQELKQSQWWKALLAKGTCHYCEQKFSKELLTMDHITPIARGGRSSRGNVVICCKDCNTKKKWMTPAEIVLSGLTNCPENGQSEN